MLAQFEQILGIVQLSRIVNGLTLLFWGLFIDRCLLLDVSFNRFTALADKLGPQNSVAVGLIVVIVSIEDIFRVLQISWVQITREYILCLHEVLVRFKVLLS